MAVANGVPSSPLSDQGANVAKVSAQSLMDTEKTLSWADRLKGSSFHTARTKLKYYEPKMEDSIPVVAPPPEVEEEGSRKWADCLIGNLLDTKLPFAVVRSILHKIWARFGLLDVIPHGAGFFIFRFSQPSAAKDVLEGGPWLISGRHLFLRWWSPGFSWQKENVSKVPVWVQFQNVPMEFWTSEGLSYIGSAVGVPLYADSSTEACTRMNFARLCIEIDASKPLVHEFKLQTSSSGTTSSPRLVTVKVTYQWKPRMCSLCCVFGHSTSDCSYQAQPANLSDNSTVPVGAIAEVMPHSQNPSSSQAWRVVGRKSNSNSSVDGTSTTDPLLPVQSNSTLAGSNAAIESVSPEVLIQSTIPTENLFDLLARQDVLNSVSKNNSECAEPPTANHLQPHLNQDISTSLNSEASSVSRNMHLVEDSSSPVLSTNLASKIKSIDGATSKLLLRPHSNLFKANSSLAAKTNNIGLNAGPSTKSPC